MRTTLYVILLALSIQAHALEVDEYRCDIRTQQCEMVKVEMAGVLTQEEAAAKEDAERSIALIKSAERAALKTKLQGLARNPPTKAPEMAAAIQELAKQMDQLLPAEPEK